MDALVSRDLFFFFSVEQKLRQSVTRDGQGRFVIDDDLAHLARWLLFDFVLVFFLFWWSLDGHVSESLFLASLREAFAVPLKEVTDAILASPKLPAFVWAGLCCPKNRCFVALALFSEHFFKYFWPDTHLFLKNGGILQVGRFWCFR
mgnify:CR=1 FL=1